MQRTFRIMKPSLLLMNAGDNIQVRPSLGSWRVNTRLGIAER